MMKLIHAYRFVGGRIADIDPLKRRDVPFIRSWITSIYGLADSDMETEFSTGLRANGQPARQSKDIVHHAEGILHGGRQWHLGNGTSTVAAQPR